MAWLRLMRLQDNDAISCSHLGGRCLQSLGLIYPERVLLPLMTTRTHWVTRFVGLPMLQQHPDKLFHRSSVGLTERGQNTQRPLGVRIVVVCSW